MPADRPAVDAPPKWIPIYVVGFLVAFSLCGLLSIEAWPLTGWRLFSALRHEEQISWRAVAVDSEGNERPVPFGRLSEAYRGHVQILKSFPGLSSEERIGVCRAWISASRRAGVDADSLRIYRTRWLLSDRSGSRARPAEREPRFECSVNEVEELPQLWLP